MWVEIWYQVHSSSIQHYFLHIIYENMMSLKITSVDYFVFAPDLGLRQTCLFHSEMSHKTSANGTSKKII